MEGELFAFAGLWDRWKDPSGNWMKTCSTLTATPNAVTAPVHDRMPVILDPDSYDLWLDPGKQNVAAVSDLLKPYDARTMRCFSVSTRINHVANDDEGALDLWRSSRLRIGCSCRNPWYAWRKNYQWGAGNGISDGCVLSTT
jgi:putative SOS response-associated peptidase YedK